MRNLRLVVPLLSVLLFVACESNPTQVNSQTDQVPEGTAQETTQAGKQDTDRGFDPCRLNSNLAVCKKQ